MSFNPERLVALINAEFRDELKTGLPAETVKAWTNQRGDFCLRIGSRDLQVDPEGRFVGAGTSLCG